MQSRAEMERTVAALKERIVIAERGLATSEKRLDQAFKLIDVMAEGIAEKQGRIFVLEQRLGKRIPPKKGKVLGRKVTIYEGSRGLRKVCFQDTLEVTWVEEELVKMVAA